MKIGINSNLKVGTYGRSIYETNLNIGVGISQINSRQLSVDIYPNPTKGIFDFRFSIPQASPSGQVSELGRVSLRIYNMQGQEVAVVLDGKWSGDQVVRWDAGALPGGIYYYQLRAKGVGQVCAGKVVKY